MICEWCGMRIEHDDELYSFYGFENYIGPICNNCMKLLRDGDEDANSSK